MDGVSSAFAVVSLAIQLVETGEKISQFLTSVQDAPSEVTKLGHTLDQLNTTLKQVSYLLEQQYLVLRLPGSPVFIANALETCEKRIKTLEDVIHKAKTAMDHRNRAHRSWAAMKFVSKKEDIREMQLQLRDAEAGLQTAMLSNSWQLQMHSISISSSGALQATTIEQPSLAETTSSVSRYGGVHKSSATHKDVLRPTAKETKFVWYHGFFGRVDIQYKSVSLSQSSYRRPENTATSEEKIIKITPIFLRKILELRLLNSFGRVSRTLSTYPILALEAPIFGLCLQGDIRGLQVAFSSGTVSPFVLDEDGWSLLHYAACWKRVDVCILLLQLGVDPDRIENHGCKPMTWASPGHFIVRTEVVVDVLRLLIQSQNDLSSRDIYEFWRFYRGPVEVAEFMFSQTEPNISDGEDTFPVLATALRLFGGGLSQWERFLRLLLHKRPSLHSPVLRSLPLEWYPCKALEYGTPLDELFRMTKTPFEGEAIASRWLEILSSEGYDVVAYLKEESALHAQQMQFTIPYFGYETPRKLLFHWGSNPSVSWDWWIDPDSSTYLVRNEFKHMDLVPYYLPRTWYDKHEWDEWDDWETVWPLWFPAWSRDDFRFNEYTYREWQLLNDRVQERANRRLRKKSMKAARAQGLKKRDRIPGAWPI